jgi:hypothetical protein
MQARVVRKLEAQPDLPPDDGTVNSWAESLSELTVRTANRSTPMTLTAASRMKQMSPNMPLKLTRSPLRWSLIARYPTGALAA